MAPRDFEPFLEQARAFLARFPEDDLYGAADAAYARWILGELPADPARVERIRSFQDPATGWFDRSLLPGHGRAHATAFATGALVLQGARPAHPLRYAEALFRNRDAIDAWLDGFRWNQVWTGSHAAGAAAAVLEAPEGLSLPGGWGEALLDALDERVDPATGFWKRALHDRVLRRPTTLDLGGAAHFWWLHDRLGRRIPCAARAFAGILALQRRSGLWGSRVFGGAFPQGIDLDALNGLRLAWRGLDDGAREAGRAPLRATLERYAETAHAVLCAPAALERHFRGPHKLVGTLNALAELDLLSRTVFDEPTTRPALRSTLTAVCWQ
jgi:hypothetical protein